MDSHSIARQRQRGGADVLDLLDDASDLLGPLVADVDQRRQCGGEDALDHSGYEVDIVSPDGGRLEADPWSDPRDASKYSAEDLITLGFVSSVEHAALVEHARALAEVRVGEYDAVFLVGGQGPTYMGCTI